MAAIGSSWASLSWADPAWAALTWAGSSPVPPPVPPVPPVPPPPRIVAVPTPVVEFLLSPLLTPSVHLGDVGTALVVYVVDERNLPVNLNLASSITVLLMPPAQPGKPQTILTRTGTMDGSGLDGAIRYVTAAGDISVTGTWSIRGQATVGSQTWSTRLSRFTVLPVL
jgi:hypothetical protein